MKPHVHGMAQDILLYGLSAIIVINLGRITAAWASRKGGMIGKCGDSVGALLTFGGIS